MRVRRFEPGPSPLRIDTIKGVSTLPAKHLITCDEFERMGDVLVFTEGARLELLEGEIIEMSPIGSPHAACVYRLNALFAPLIGRAIIGVQNPIRLGDISEPQPDVFLLRSKPDYYASGHATPDEVLLVVEVSDTSLAFDRHRKRPMYAAAGIAELWIVDIAGEVIEIATDPRTDGYASILRRGRGEHVVPSCFPDLSLGVDEILG